MTRSLVAMGLTLVCLSVSACASTHARSSDVGPVDAPLVIVDARSADAGPPDAVSLARVTCGPNTCRVGEICCNEACGICAVASECVDFGCGGP